MELKFGWEDIQMHVPLRSTPPTNTRFLNNYSRSLNNVLSAIHS